MVTLYSVIGSVEYHSWRHPVITVNARCRQCKYVRQSGILIQATTPCPRCGNKTWNTAFESEWPFGGSDNAE